MELTTSSVRTFSASIEGQLMCYVKLGIMRIRIFHNDGNSFVSLSQDWAEAMQTCRRSKYTM